MNKRTKTAIAVTMIAAAFGYLMLTGLRQGSMYYLELAEFDGQKAEMAGKKIRLNGEVVDDSIDYDSMNQRMTFIMRDIEGSETVPVVYHGPPPDLLGQDGVTVVAEGKYSAADKLFDADKLLVKCPSKYERGERAQKENV